MPTRADIIASARSLKGTPYLHQGRVAGEKGGVDCIGVPLLIGRELGMKPETWNFTGYRRLPDGFTLMAHLREHMGAEIGQEEMQPGDLVVVSFGRHPHHVGVVVDYHLGGLGLVHANGQMRKVVETQLVFTAEMKFVTAFRFPGVY